MSEIEPPDGATETDAGSLLAALRHHLDGDEREVRDRVRELLCDPLFHPRSGMDRDTHRARVWDQMHRLATAGLSPALAYGSDQGGADDPAAGIAAFETLAFGSLSLLVKAGVQWGLFGGAINNLGTPEQKERWLPSTASLDLPGCFAMTEIGHGSDVQNLRTTAVYDPASDQIIVHTPDEDAAKDYIGNAARDGRAAVVFAQLITGGDERTGEQHGVHAVFVPIRDDAGEPLPGITIADDGPKAGLNGVDNGRIVFDHVAVPRTNLLARFGHIEPDGTYHSDIESTTRRFFTMLGTLVMGRVSVAGAAVSASEVALTIAVRYGDVRRQFADPSGAERRLLDYQAYQENLLPALATTYALHYAQRDLRRRLVTAFGDDDPAARREVESLAAGLKAVATWHATDTIQRCREACGGAGYLSENRLPDLRADTDVFTTFEGANTVLLQLVAKGLLTGYQQEFSQLDQLETVRFAVDMAADTIVERLRGAPLMQSLRGLMPRSSGDGNVRDRGWQDETFTYRAEHTLETASARIRARMEDNNDPFEAFNGTQSHLITAARAHVDQLVFEQFTAAVDTCTDDVARRALELVVDLHALATIRQHSGWYQEHGRFSAATSKTITREFEALLAEVRPLAVDLVNAFGVPEPSVAAPIATGAEARRQQLRAEAND